MVEDIKRADMECGEGVTREMMATAESGNFELRKTKLDLSLITFMLAVERPLRQCMCGCVIVLLSCSIFRFD